MLLKIIWTKTSPTVAPRKTSSPSVGRYKLSANGFPKTDHSGFVKTRTQNCCEYVIIVLFELVRVRCSISVHAKTIKWSSLRYRAALYHAAMRPAHFDIIPSTVFKVTCISALVFIFVDFEKFGLSLSSKKRRNTPFLLSNWPCFHVRATRFLMVECSLRKSGVQGGWARGVSIFRGRSWRLLRWRWA